MFNEEKNGIRIVDTYDVMLEFDNWHLYLLNRLKSVHSKCLYNRVKVFEKQFQINWLI